jgi:hypothetical protein
MDRYEGVTATLLNPYDRDSPHVGPGLSTITASPPGRIHLRFRMRFHRLQRRTRTAIAWA